MEQIQISDEDQKVCSVDDMIKTMLKAIEEYVDDPVGILYSMIEINQEYVKIIKYI